MEKSETLAAFCDRRQKLTNLVALSPNVVLMIFLLATLVVSLPPFSRADVLDAANPQVSQTTPGMKCWNNVANSSTGRRQTSGAVHASYQPLYYPANGEPIVLQGDVSGTKVEWGVYNYWTGEPDPNGLKRMRITISGTNVAGTLLPPTTIVDKDFSGQPLPHPKYWEQGVRYDSTQFKHGSVITLVGEMWSERNTYTSVIERFRVTNKALVLANHDLKNPLLQNCANRAQTTLKELLPRFGHHVRASQRYRKPTIQSLLPGYNVFFISTHGVPGRFLDCYEDVDDDGDENWLWSRPEDQIGPHIARKESSLGQVPYSFVFVHGCSVFGDGIGSYGDPDEYREDRSVAAAFLSGSATGSISGPGSNRAAIGWKNDVLGNRNYYNYVRSLMHSLGTGATLQEALIAAKMWSTCWGVVGYLPLFGAPVYSTISPVVFGDGKMTLHGLYGQPGTRKFGFPSDERGGGSLVLYNQAQ